MLNSNQPLATNEHKHSGFKQHTFVSYSFCDQDLAQLAGFSAQGPSQAKVNTPGGLGLSFRAPLGKDLLPYKVVGNIQFLVCHRT